MSVILYQVGTQKDINGLMCNILKLEPSNFSALLPGWFFSPEDAYKAFEPIPGTEDKEITEEPKILKGNSKIRDDARKAGIQDFDKARISTLKEKLKA